MTTVESLAQSLKLMHISVPLPNSYKKMLTQWHLPNELLVYGAEDLSICGSNVWDQDLFFLLHLFLVYFRWRAFLM